MRINFYTFVDRLVIDIEETYLTSFRILRIETKTIRLIKYRI